MIETSLLVKIVMTLLRDQYSTNRARPLPFERRVMCSASHWKQPVMSRAGGGSCVLGGGGGYSARWRLTQTQERPHSMAGKAEARRVHIVHLLTQQSKQTYMQP